MGLRIEENGYREWQNSEGQLHRIDGPARELSDGSKEWWINGKYHRTDGPACEDINGDKEWWVNGKLHRTDGPACEYSNGYKFWYLKDIEYTKKEYYKKKNKISN